MVAEKREREKKDSTLFQWQLQSMNPFSADGMRKSSIPQIKMYTKIMVSYPYTCLMILTLSSSSRVFGQAWKPSLNHCRRNMKVYPEPNLSQCPSGTNLSRSISNSPRNCLRLSKSTQPTKLSLHLFTLVAEWGAFLLVSWSNTDWPVPPDTGGWDAPHRKWLE